LRRSGDLCADACAHHRLVWLVQADLGLESLVLVGCDVRRVRDDEVERPFDSGEQIALHEGDSAVDSGALLVLARQRQGLFRAVHRDDLGALVLVGDRKRDRARADADVQNTWLDEVVEEGQAALDDDLGLGPRDQGTFVHRQKQPAKAPLAEDVGERLAMDAAPDELVQSLAFVGRDRAVRRVELGARHPEHVGDQDLGVDAGRGDSRGAQPALDLVDLIQGHLDSFAADSHGFLTPQPLRAPAAAPPRRALR
jgi:hypothetical protein